ncbi:MAG: MFS transporter [Acidobacteria bacterium]|nr:MFS transporter [Acidobacteriota bacterium]
MGASDSGSAISLRRRRAITAGLLLGMSLGALEATVVGTAMPTVIATLGGLAHYSWVFSAYLLTSTASVPIWGRLSDLYGRRRMYLTGIAVFLIGSMASGAATSMTVLIVSRAVQGLGAGAVIPLSLTIIGELYTLKERARAQALFSGVWGVASVAGPLVGGYITDALSWRWVFYLNLPFGLTCAAVLLLAYPPTRRSGAVRVDWPGAGLLFAGISALLLALGGDTGGAAWWLGGAAAALLASFAVVEHRSPDPLLPVDLLRNPLVARTLTVVFLVGMALFGAIAFIPLFVQGVMGGTATQAGQVLTPLFMGWVLMSVASARLTVKVGYRKLAMAGSVLMTAGFIGLSTVGAESARRSVLAAGLFIGGGMGLSMLSLLLAVQHGVARAHLGLATSLNQFSRSVGAAVGVAIMGALLTRRLPGISTPGGVEALAATGAMLTGAARVQFAAALHQVFVTGAALAPGSIVATLFLPPVDFSDGVAPDAGEQMLAAEMANLEPEDEPVAVPEG